MVTKCRIFETREGKPTDKAAEGVRLLYPAGRTIPDKLAAELGVKDDPRFDAGITAEPVEEDPTRKRVSLGGEEAERQREEEEAKAKAEEEAKAKAEEEAKANADEAAPFDVLGLRHDQALALKARFGTLEDLSAASDADVLEVEGIGTGALSKVREHFEKQEG